MKQFALLVFLWTTLCISNAAPALDDLTTKLRAVFPAPEWEMVREARSVTFTHKDVLFLNGISLPAMTSEQELWDKYSFKADYRFTITIGPNVSQSEYDQLVKLQKEIISQRTKGVEKGSKHFASIASNAKGVVRLPDYYLQQSSFYVESSDANVCSMRPVSVNSAVIKAKEILDQTLSKYRQ
jgi:hypothetical protein